MYSTYLHRRIVSELCAICTSKRDPVTSKTLYLPTLHASSWGAEALKSSGCVVLLKWCYMTAAVQYIVLLSYIIRSCILIEPLRNHLFLLK